ncbi:MAG: hypothetical protein J6Y78_05935 [Paludibacteraceae bacterium]|nr:hypothetical protein [Paludibacteraceae bacterium]
MTKQELIEMLNKAQEAERAVGRMISIALQSVLAEGTLQRGDHIGGDVSKMTAFGDLSEVINHLKPTYETLTIVKPKWNYDEQKKYFMDAMIPFMSGIRMALDNKGLRGAVDWREVTINNHDYIDLYSGVSCLTDLDEIFEEIWKLYFLEGNAQFDEKSEFTWDLYYNNEEENQAKYEDVTFRYEKDKLYLSWRSFYAVFIPVYLNYYTKED